MVLDVRTTIFAMNFVGQEAAKTFICMCLLASYVHASVSSTLCSLQCCFTVISRTIWLIEPPVSVLLQAEKAGTRELPVKAHLIPTLPISLHPSCHTQISMNLKL